MNSFIIVWSFIIVIMFLISIIKNIDLKSEIVSTGVLGTFIGILFALQHFDVTNVKEALPQILDGMKLAFITSVESMMASIIISIIYKAKSKKSNMELMLDKQDKIIKLLDKSSIEQTSEFIEALNSITNQFNTDMVEQFGSNFAKLDKTVEQFLEYQKNHQESIQRLYKGVVIVTDKNKEINTLYTKLSENTKELTDEMKKSTNIIKESLSLSLRKANGR